VSEVVGPPGGAVVAWQSRAGQAWTDLNAQTDRQLDPLGRLALDRLAPKPGERVLDVGCGCGQTLLQLAAAVGPTGRVLGVDVSDVMLDQARARVAEAAAAPPVEILCADAASHRFAAATFDAIYSRFGVMFFEQPPAAFQHLRATLAPEGRLAFVSWQSMDRNDWALVPLRAVRAAIPEAPLPALFAEGGPGPFALADPAQVAELLEGAGFRDVLVEALTVEVHVGGAATLEEAMQYLLRIGPAARQLAEAEPARRQTGEEALARAMAPYVSERGVWMKGAVLVVTARG
jgi:SAM-dependent methyltransferase